MSKFGTFCQRLEVAQQKVAEQVAGNASELIIEAVEQGHSSLYALDLRRNKELGRGASLLVRFSMSPSKYANLVGAALERNHGIASIIHPVYGYSGDSASENAGTDLVVDTADLATRPRYPYSAHSRQQGVLVHRVLGIYYPPDYTPNTQSEETYNQPPWNAETPHDD